MNTETEKRLRAAWMTSSKGTFKLVYEMSLRFDCTVAVVMDVIFRR